MTIHAKGPSRLWLLVPKERADQVLALNADYRNIRVSTVADQRFASLAQALGVAALLIGEKCGSYCGIIGGRPILSRRSGLSEAAIRAQIGHKHPTWSDDKIARALRDVLKSETHNALHDYAKRDYARMWEFLRECVFRCGTAVMVYDPGLTATLDELVPTPSMLRERIRDAPHITLNDHSSTVLYSVHPYEFYVFRDIPGTPYINHGERGDNCA